MPLRTSRRQLPAEPKRNGAASTMIRTIQDEILFDGAPIAYGNRRSENKARTALISNRLQMPIIEFLF